jgi:hypothetical protein
MIRLLLGHYALAPDKLGETPYGWAMKIKRLTSKKLLRGENCENLETVENGHESPVYGRTPAFFSSNGNCTRTSTPFVPLHLNLSWDSIGLMMGIQSVTELFSKEISVTTRHVFL